MLLYNLLLIKENCNPDLRWLIHLSIGHLSFVQAVRLMYRGKVPRLWIIIVDFEMYLYLNLSKKYKL